MSAPAWGDPRLDAAMWSRIIPEPNSGCWLYLGAIAGGYGLVSRGRRHQVAHRYVYEALVEPLPEFVRRGPRVEVDHKCLVPLCVNPSHLEVVTSQINTLRSSNPAAKNAAKSVCPRGHAYTAENTRLIHYRGRVGRRCITCARARDRGEVASPRVLGSGTAPAPSDT